MGWYVAGTVIGELIGREIDKKRELQARVAARPDPRSFAPIAPPLPADGWVEAVSFRAGYPWGWQALDHPDHSGPYLGCGPRQLMRLRTPRADDRTVGIAAKAIRPLPVEQLLDGAAGLHDARARDRQLDRYGGISCVLVDGAPGLLIHLRGRSSDPGLTDITAIASEVWTHHNGNLHLIDMLGPESDYAGYLQAFWTVLGTWKWR